MFDTHSHLSLFTENELDFVTTDLEGVINCSTNLEDCLTNLKINHPKVKLALGIHPEHSASEIDEKDLVNLENLIDDNVSKIIAIGETGLDYYHTNTRNNIEPQKISFRRHVQIAKKLNLPLISLNQYH